jgi:E3 ubiquitin-protein ligase RAD18
VADVVEKFVAARAGALELARKDRTDKEVETKSSSKRKLDDTDLEQDASPGRVTRAWRTRNRNGGSSASLQREVVEVPDSEDEGEDEEFVPEGTVRCPICKEQMPEARVYNHLDVCPGQQPSRGQRSTRSRYGDFKDHFDSTVINGHAGRTTLSLIPTPPFSSLINPGRVHPLQPASPNSTTHS